MAFQRRRTALSADRAPAVHPAARLAATVIVPRALVVWGLCRLIFAAVQMAAGTSQGASQPQPIAVVLVASLLGLLDVRVRGERVLWANLGVGSVLLFLLYAAGAMAGEVVLALVSR